MLTFVISRFRLNAFQNFIAEFWTLLNFENFRLVIRKQHRKLKKPILQSPCRLYDDIEKSLTLSYFSIFKTGRKTWPGHRDHCIHIEIMWARKNTDMTLLQYGFTRFS